MSQNHAEFAPIPSTKLLFKKKKKVNIFFNLFFVI